MSLKAGIFNSTTVETTESGLPRGDRAVDAAYIAQLLSALMTNGVCAHVGAGFASRAVGGEAGSTTAMQVVTGSGACMIDGHFAYDTATDTRSFSVSTADRTVARLYRLDKSAGTMTALWKECVRRGSDIVVKSDNRVLPVRNGTVYDLVTAVVDIPAGTTVITDAMVTDLRSNPNYCGIAKANG